MKSQNQDESHADQNQATNKQYHCWVWSETLQAFVHSVSERLDGCLTLEQAVAHFKQLYGVDRLFRIDQDDVIKYINEQSAPQQLSLFDM